MRKPISFKQVKKFFSSKKINSLLIGIIIFLGIFLRIYLAYFFKGNNDMRSYELVSALVLEGKNVYAFTHRYNYSPFWFLILGVFKRINILLPFFSFYFLVRFFLTLIDLITLYVLYLLAKLKQTSFLKLALGFFLNPISIILTGYHGQFENITILLILLAVYFYQKEKKFKLSWLLFTFAGIVKQLIFNQLIIFLNFAQKNKRKMVLFFCLSVFIFLATFTPFWQEGKKGIIKNVFFYSSGGAGPYGFTSVFNKLKLPKIFYTWHKILFYPLYFIFPFILHRKKLIKNLLMGMLFFLVFTVGFATQYAILPIALGSLNGGIGFVVYSVICSLYLGGHKAELNIQWLRIINNGEVWLAAVFWFLIEAYFYFRYQKKIFYKR